MIHCFVKLLGLLPFLLTLFSGSLATAKERRCPDLFREAINSQALYIPYKKLMYTSGEILASYQGIEIESFVKNSHLYKDMAQTLVEKIHTFHQHMADLGFQIPKTTRIVISKAKPMINNGIVAGTVLGYSSTHLVWNLNRGLQPVAGINIDNEIASLPTMLQNHISFFLHEYTHNIMLRFYNRFAFTNASHGENSMHEALADFFPAHESGIPLFGKNMPWERDIEKKTFQGSDKTQLQHTFGSSVYIDSIHYSNALWKTRQVLDNSTFSSLIKNFIDNLNLYHDSFVTLKGWDAKEITYKTYKRRAIDELEFFLAVLRRTMIDTNHEDDMPKIDRIISEIAYELELQTDHIAHISQTITKSKNDIFYDHTTEMEIGHIIKNQQNLNILRNTLLIAGIPIAIWTSYRIYKYITSENSD